MKNYSIILSELALAIESCATSGRAQNETGMTLLSDEVQFWIRRIADKIQSESLDSQNEMELLIEDIEKITGDYKHFDDEERQYTAKRKISKVKQASIDLLRDLLYEHQAA